jgi:hypothetical protein
MDVLLAMKGIARFDLRPMLGLRLSLSELLESVLVVRTIRAHVVGFVPAGVLEWFERTMCTQADVTMRRVVVVAGGFG